MTSEFKLYTQRYLLYKKWYYNMVKRLSFWKFTNDNDFWGHSRYYWRRRQRKRRELKIGDPAAWKPWVVGRKPSFWIFPRVITINYLKYRLHCSQRLFLLFLRNCGHSRYAVITGGKGESSIKIRWWTQLIPGTQPSQLLGVQTQPFWKW